MNKTEQKGFKWILKQGIPKSSIHYQARRSPDFVTEDGQWFETKRVVGGTIVFGAKQFDELKRNDEKTTILAFTDDSEKPIVIPMTEIEPGRIVRGVKVHVAPRIQPTTKSRLVHVWVDPDLLEEYREYKPETKGLTYTALVDMIVRERLVELQRLQGEREIEPHRSSGKNVKISPSIH